MAYALDIGLRYLRSKKREVVSSISVIAVTGVALGVAALLAVVSITSGFQEEFRNKVLGVNAHVLVLKYGLNFEEYRDVIARARKLPTVTGAAPFIINEMMLAKGDRPSRVLIKGIDPELMPGVLDLPSQMVQGSLDGLRTEHARPATRASDLERDLGKAEQQDLDAYLEGLATAPTKDGGVTGASVEDDADPPAAPEPAQPVADATEPPPKVEVPSLAEAAAALAAEELGELPSDELEQRLVERSEPEPSQRPDLQSLPGVAVGKALAESLRIRVGDQVKVISPLSGLDTSLWRADGGKPSSRDYRVVGVFEAGFQEYDSRLVYMDLYEAQILQDQGDTVVGVELRLSDIDRASEIALRLERELGGGPFHTMDWKELNHNLFTALELQKVILSIVFAIIVLVAAFCVIVTLIMIVLEKRRDIAILKAMGARDGAILRIFMVQGAAIGSFGTLLGLVVGGGLCAYLSWFKFPLDPNVYLIHYLPVRTSLSEIGLTAAIAFGICVTATIIPSYSAARLLPADGVRPQ